MFFLCTHGTIGSANLTGAGLGMKSTRNRNYYEEKTKKDLLQIKSLN